MWYWQSMSEQSIAVEARDVSNTGAGTEFPCYFNHHLQLHLEYQPGSRIPDIHLIVATGYLGLTAVALAAVWLIVRRTNLSAG